MKGMPGTVILHPSLSASTLSTDLDCQGPRTYAAPRIGKPLTLARKQRRRGGGLRGWNANRMSRLGVDEAECGTTRPAKWHWRGQ